jgi:hypothetical protein
VAIATGLHIQARYLHILLGNNQIKDLKHITLAKITLGSKDDNL